MARTGGRSVWIAVPAGLLCMAVVAALVWLAIPAVPGVLQWTGDTLRRATIAAEPEVRVTPAQLAAEGNLDCRDLYPQELWADLLWADRSRLAQDLSAPATAATDLVDALAPDVHVTCRWSATAGTVVSTLAAVGPDAAGLADAALRGQGFACTVDDTAVRCTRAADGVIEDHVVRDGLWLVSVESAWHPAEYAAQLDAYVWGR